jgi:hypothetical protein
MIEDFGDIFDNKVPQNSHLDVEFVTASSCLGFSLRCSHEFDDIYVYKSLYCSLVRHFIEYSSIVWTSNYNEHIDRIDSLFSL